MTTPEGQLIGIRLKINPDPPRSGENQIQVSIQNADGTAVMDAVVSTVFYMPAMPSMSMPEMRSELALTQAEGGIYRGKGNLEMAGTWDVTVKVSKEGIPLGTGKRTIIAK